jgi:hypothetical protein
LNVEDIYETTKLLVTLMLYKFSFSMEISTSLQLDSVDNCSAMRVPGHLNSPVAFKVLVPPIYSTTGMHRQVIILILYQKNPRLVVPSQNNS